MKLSRKVAFVGVFTALSMVVSTLERLIPLSLVVPLPGVKLGLANIMVMFVLYKRGARLAWSVQVLRILLSALLFGTPVSFMMSLCGGVAALLVQQLLYRKRPFSVIGVSIAGAASHHIGQILAAAAVLQSVYIVAYLPILLLLSIVTGAVTGLILYTIIK